MILKAEQLIKVYRQGEESIYAVDHASIAIEEGQFAVITGQSGSGKSTFLNLCAGMLKPTSGKVIFQDQTVTEMDYDQLSAYHREGIGMVFQSFDLLSIMTVRENIMLPAILSHRTPEKHHFDEIVETLGIADRLDHFPNELSGGQAQRTAIARALINHPKLILADEPTGNLDPGTANEIISLLLRVNASGVACMLVTHDRAIRDRVLNEAKNAAAYHMENGMMKRM